MHEKLIPVRQLVELVDAGGQVLGRFVPESSHFSLDPNISDEKLQHREVAGGGRSLAEILGDLERKV